MRVYRSLSELQLRDTTIAVGVFDGVHRGHQKVLSRVHESAHQVLGGFSMAMTFDRHPAEVVAPRYAPNYLSCLSQRIEFIAAYAPVDAVLVVPFDQEFANLTAFEFVKNVLVERLGVLRIFVGADFRYGKDRVGTVMDLQAAGEAFHFGVDVIHSVAFHGERISSTRIREKVAAGDIAAAQELLGHQFAIRGKVVPGKKLGRTIGYPTANIEPEQTKQILPSLGVYAATIRLLGAIPGRYEWPAAVSVGLNPTTDDDRRVKVEAYIMDGFDQDIYGQNIDVHFLEKLRDEIKFDSLEQLKNQIGRDVEKTREITSGLA